MTTVTVHNPDVTVTPAASQEAAPTGPSLPPIPVNFDRPAAGMPAAYPLGPTVGLSPQIGAYTAQESPTQSVVAAGSKHFRTKDTRGRIIGIRKMGAGERMKIMRVLGGDLSDNMSYFGHAMLAACVRELDGEPIPMPTTPLQVEQLVERLDDDGLEAIANGIKEAGWVKIQSEKGLLDDAKN